MILSRKSTPNLEKYLCEIKSFPYKNLILIVEFFWQLYLYAVVVRTANVPATVLLLGVRRKCQIFQIDISKTEELVRYIQIYRQTLLSRFSSSRWLFIHMCIAYMYICTLWSLRRFLLNVTHFVVQLCSVLLFKV